jgi:hypothetical protein
MPIVPDDRNWTFVLDEVCAECGFESQSFTRERIGSLLRANAAQWPALLARPKAKVRPNDHTWSALEYGCHVRDVFRLFHYRLDLMLTNDEPKFANWDQDETAIADRYDLQDPETISGELLQAVEPLASLYDSVHGDQWQRTGIRSDGSFFTVESFGRYLLHDPEHHIHDVETGYRSLST